MQLFDFGWIGLLTLIKNFIYTKDFLSLYYKHNFIRLNSKYSLKFYFPFEHN